MCWGGDEIMENELNPLDVIEKLKSKNSYNGNDLNIPKDAKKSAKKSLLPTG